MEVATVCARRLAAGLGLPGGDGIVWPGGRGLTVRRFASRFRLAAPGGLVVVKLVVVVISGLEGLSSLPWCLDLMD